MRADAADNATCDSAGRPGREAAVALLLPLLKWDTLEDRSRLERAGVGKTKEAFLEWRAGTCVVRDDEGADHMFVRLAQMARFRYFVMVDDESLASVPDVGRKAANRGLRLLDQSPMKVRVVDAGAPDDKEKARLYALGGSKYFSSAGNDNGDLKGDGKESDDDDGDEVDWFMGWTWVETSSLLGFYDVVQADSGWDCFYERPPKVYPRRRAACPWYRRHESIFPDRLFTWL